MSPRLPVLFLAGVLALAGCGGSDEQGYDGDFEQGFLEVCEAAVAADDQAVCQCTYDKMAETVPFERAERIDNRLRDDPEASLPDDIAELFADCVAASVPPTISTTTSSTEPPAGGSTTTVAPGGSTTTIAGESTTTTAGEAG